MTPEIKELIYKIFIAVLESIYFTLVVMLIVLSISMVVVPVYFASTGTPKYVKQRVVFFYVPK